MAIGDVQNFAYTGAVQTVLLSANKKYKIECFGGQGGNSGGKGGYVYGEVIYSSDTNLNLYVGASGTNGGFNGGGSGTYYGGGATDVRINGISLTDRILVAGGGGGRGKGSSTVGDGGGLSGGDGNGGTGGTQTTGNALGIGGNTGRTEAGGGGGGYWGGYGAGWHFQSGGGGSSYYGDMLHGFTVSGINSGNGYIIITEISLTSIVIQTSLTINSSQKPESLFLSKGRYKFDLYGAQGALSKSNAIGGFGGYVSGEFEFESDTFIQLFVGKQGSGIVGGFNGGGNGSTNSSNGAAGGGATDIRVEDASLSNRILVAGGGGGQSTQITTDGIVGAGGGLSGNNGTNFGNYGAGAGGTQTTGNALGIGASGSAIGSGGGGGGYWGGRVGGNYCGGGGGSSYYGDAENTITTTGINKGDGYIIITSLSFTSSSRKFAQII